MAGKQLAFDISARDKLLKGVTSYNCKSHSGPAGLCGAR